MSKKTFYTLVFYNPVTTRNIYIYRKSGYCLYIVMIYEEDIEFKTPYLPI